MEEKVLNRKDVPMGYPLCFNNECTKKACCMHYQARLLMPENRFCGSAVFPTASVSTITKLAGTLTDGIKKAQP